MHDFQPGDRVELLFTSIKRLRGTVRAIEPVSHHAILFVVWDRNYAPGHIIATSARKLSPIERLAEALES